MDKSILSILLLLSLTGFSTCVYETQYKEEQGYYKEQGYKQPPPRILSHHQAQNHDGGFKFAYTAENGLAQSEVIAPDGTRNGGYTYVDPHGKTISVKYTAGKDGFRIIEGDHIPREATGQMAAVHQPQQNQQYYQPIQQQIQYPKKVDFSYKPESYSRSESFLRPESYGRSEESYAKPEPVKPLYKTFVPQPQARYETQERYENTVEDKEPQYNDEPGKPHSFGAGYAFHFGS